MVWQTAICLHKRSFIIFRNISDQVEKVLSNTPLQIWRGVQLKRRSIMKSINPISSPKKTIRNITLIALAAVFLIYIVLNIVFWKRGMPERFFEYEITENSSVEIRYCSAPFFLLNVPDTIEGKPVTSIGGLFGNSFLEAGKYNYMKHYVVAVRLPDTVEEIHYGAFRDCKNLRSINIPACLKYASSHILAGTKEMHFPSAASTFVRSYSPKV